MEKSLNAQTENKKKVVQILIHSEISGAGFVISKEGHIATCYHNIPPGAAAFITARFPFAGLSNKVYDAEIFALDEGNDIAILKISGYDPDIGFFSFQPSVGIYHEKIYTYGFPKLGGIEYLLATGDIVDCNGTENGFRRIQVRTKEIEKGFSGAPLILADNGLVVGMIYNIVEPDRSFRNIETSFSIPSEYIATLCPDASFLDRSTQLEKEITGHNTEELATLNQEGIYEEHIFYKRNISNVIDQFMLSEDTILLITGESGIGKTNALLYFVQHCTATVLPLYFNCTNYASLRLLEILKAKISILKSETDLSFSDALLQIEQNMSQSLVIIFDDLEKLNLISIQNFKNFLLQIHEYNEKSRIKLIKFIFSVNKDCINEYLPGFATRTGTTLSQYDYELFYVDTDNTPYFEIFRFGLDEELSSSELQQVYELYREKQFINYYNKKVGVKPLTSFEYLEDNIKRLISHPFTLKAFLISYHDREIPENISSIDVYTQLVNHFYERISDFSKTLVGSLNNLLSGIADEIYVKNHHSLTIMRSNEPYIPDYFALLNSVLRNTVFLTELQKKFNPFENKEVRFSSDWYFEYFLFLSMYSKLQKEQPSAKAALLNRYFDADNRSSLNALRSMTILASLVFQEEESLEKKLTYNMINDVAKPAQSQLFTNFFFDSIRLNYSFAKISSTDLLSVKYLNEDGAVKILNYIEKIEENGYYADALSLLLRDEFWENFEHNQQISNRRYISIAYNYFHKHIIDVSLNYIDRVTADFPNEYRAKYNFIKGRCYQFRQEYPTAIQIYADSAKEESMYGFRCAHQLAFTEMMQSSNYELVGTSLTGIIHKMSGVLSFEQQLVTKMLYATCLFRMSKYEEAEIELKQIIFARKKSRNYHKEGTALRALAELYFCLFEKEKALDTINRSIELLEKTTHFLSQAYSLDIKAQVLATISGDLNGAHDCIQRAISLCALDGKNAAANSWSHQTHAMIYGLGKDLENMQVRLKQSEAIFSTPFQKMRESFILILSNAMIDKAYAQLNKNKIKRLIRDFKQSSIGWYPSMLDLLLHDRNKAGKILDIKTNKPVFDDSFICDQIFGSLPTP